MPKIVLFMDNPVIPTGYASTCRLTAKELAKRGWDIYAVTFNGGQQHDYMVEWYGIKLLPNYALKRDPNLMYGDAQTVIQIFDEVKPDILLFHNDSYRYSYLEKLPQNILDRSIFWLPFEGEQPDVLGITLFKKCAATRFVTEKAFNIHADQLKDLDIGIIPHAIDDECYKKHPNKSIAKAEAHPELQNKFIVSRIDRHQPRKYWKLSLEGFAKFAKDKEDVFFLAKCDPRDLTMYDQDKNTGQDLEAIAKDLGIEKKISFNNFFFNGPFMAKTYYWPADVFLTTTSGEGFGLGLVESIACGTPVICPDVPVLPEVLGDTASFCKIKTKEWHQPMSMFYNIVDTDDVAQKLEDAYRHWKAKDGVLEQLSEKCIEKAKDYSPKNVYDQWDILCKSVMRRVEMVSIVTVLYVLSPDQLEGEDSISKLEETISKYVKYQYEWIIVDNGSPEREKTRKWIAKAANKNPYIKPIYLDWNHGFAGANNIGISQAKGKYICLTNPDSEVLDNKKLGLPADFLKMMVDKAHSDNHIGVIGMEINRRDDVMTGSIFPYFCNVLITRECLDACKLAENKWLDENFFPAYYEDLDFSIRAKGKNFKVTSINIPFWHKSGGTNKYAIEGGKDGPYTKHISQSIEDAKDKLISNDTATRKQIELKSDGMQGLIRGNIEYLKSKWGVQARQKIKVVWQTHIGAAVGFSQIAEGLIPELYKLGFDVYVKDWSNGANIENPLIRQLYEKTKKVEEESDELDDAIHIVCWLMETYSNVDASYRVGVSFCESTRVRPQYLQHCNSMDRILTFSDFCRNVQKSSGFTAPIHVIPPGVNPIFINYYERPKSDKFKFLAVGVAQDRKDTRRLVGAFCEAFPKNSDVFPDRPTGMPIKPNQVELILKSNNFGELDWVHSEGFTQQANIRTIFTGWDKRAQRKDYSTQEMFDLYCEADCLVHPSHGEGIGYPILEAAATGLPVIFTNWSSPAEYLNETNSYPLCLGPNGTDFSDAYVGHGNVPGENGKWANCHMGHLKYEMLNVISNRQDALSRGKSAHEHIKNNFNWEESARHLMPLLFEWDEDRKKKSQKESFNLETFKRPKLEPIEPNDRVLIDVVSRDRHSYLCSLLTSLLGQTFKNWDIIIQCDDSDESMPNSHQIRALMDRFQYENHGWKIIRSYQQGPHIAHDRTLSMAKSYKLVCRIDDDIFLRPDFLDKLFEVYLSDKEASIAAISGVYLDPRRPDTEQRAPKDFETDINYAGKIQPNVMWPYVCLYPEGTKPRQVEHLYSSFMYRREAADAIGGYCRRFSQIGHREESDFSYRMHLAGWKLLIQPKAIGFHYYAPSGGIRSSGIIDKHALAESDNKIYMRRLQKWQKQIEQKNKMEKSKEQISCDNFKKNKAIIVINGGTDIECTKKSIDMFSKYVDDIYVTTTAVDGKQILAQNEKIKMVASTQEDIVLLTKAVLSEGDHEFVMTISDSMTFESNPLALLDDRYDDYIFEVFKTYLPGRVLATSNNDSVFIEDPSCGTIVGPEIQNMCLITRRRPISDKPSLERALYSDIQVLDNSKIIPVNGKSVFGNELLNLDHLFSKNWRKICVYQYPEGWLKEHRYVDIKATETVVSIVIPTMGRIGLLKKCINSIYSNTSTPFEIIIIDNNSQDGTAEWLEKETKIRPSIRVFRQPENLGYQKSINLAISKCRGKYILLFNDDAWVDGREPDGRDWLSVYKEELDLDEKLGIIGPHIGKSPALGTDLLFFWCVMFKRSLYDKIGQLDDIMFKNYGGDDDYCERIRMAGYTIKSKHTNLRHLMNCIPDNIKMPELEESRIKLMAKYGVKK